MSELTFSPVLNGTHYAVYISFKLFLSRPNNYRYCLVDRGWNFFQVAHDLKPQGLSELLGIGKELPFIIDLACLASKRDYLKLEKWLEDKYKDYKVVWKKSFLEQQSLSGQLDREHSDADQASSPSEHHPFSSGHRSYSHSGHSQDPAQVRPRPHHPRVQPPSPKTVQWNHESNALLATTGESS